MTAQRRRLAAHIVPFRDIQQQQFNMRHHNNSDDLGVSFERTHFKCIFFFGAMKYITSES